MRKYRSSQHKGKVAENSDKKTVCKYFPPIVYVIYRKAQYCFHNTQRHQRKRKACGGVKQVDYSVLGRRQQFGVKADEQKGENLAAEIGDKKYTGIFCEFVVFSHIKSSDKNSA